MPQLPLLLLLRGCIIGEALMKYTASTVLVPEFIFKLTKGSSLSPKPRLCNPRESLHRLDIFFASDIIVTSYYHQRFPTHREQPPKCLEK
jgi:hypothetical protein